MQGIYFINNRIKINDLSKEDCFKLQEQSLHKYISENNLQIIKLNPNQLTDFYTVPHALLYDLKKEKRQLDFLLIYSDQVMNDFIYTYPARWLILKSFFSTIISIGEQSKSLTMNIG